MASLSQNPEIRKQHSVQVLSKTESRCWVTAVILVCSITVGSGFAQGSTFSPLCVEYLHTLSDVVASFMSCDSWLRLMWD